ncbi:MAG TPA: addiction module protein [Longimicrobium sp.]
MRSITKRIIEDALALPREERETIARVMLESLDEPADLDPEWQEEIANRIAEIRSGTAEMIPGEVVMAEIDEIVNGAS